MPMNGLKERSTMGQSEYWDGILRRGLSRRALLRRGGQAGLVAVGVTTLAGCSPGGTTPAATSAAVPAGTSAPAAGAAGTAAPTIKRGGVFVDGDSGNDAPQLDPHLVNTILLTGRGPGNAYGRLLTANASPSRKGAELVPFGELADSWTQADDTTYVFKLKQGVK